MDAHISLFLLFTGIIICYGQRCDNNQLSRCRDDVRRRNDRRASDMSSSECRQFRQDFDCLIDQTTLCIHDERDKEEYGIDIQRAHSTLQTMCDRKEGWDRNQCFEKDEIGRCEENMPRRIRIADTDTCRKYQELQDCVDRVVDKYCSRSDRAYLRSFYMDVARDLPWKCSTSSGHRPDFDPNHRNRSSGDEKQCCQYERCEDRDRSRNCREELIRNMDGRSSSQPYGNNHDLCRRLTNEFNCLLWHTYNCQLSHEKDINTLRNAKDYIERKCDTAGDLQRNRCYDEPQVKDCDRYLTEDSPSQSDVTCREYSSFVECIDRQIRGCDSQAQLLQGIYLVNRVGEKAWSCSKRDTSQTGYPTYDPRYTNPNPYSTGRTTEDDYSCEMRARREHRKCLEDSTRLDEEARRETNHREKHVKGCCVAYNFKDCTRKVVRQVCQRERSSVVDGLMGISMTNRLHECEDVDQSTCSGSRMLNNAIIIVLAVAIFRSIFQV